MRRRSNREVMRKKRSDKTSLRNRGMLSIIRRCPTHEPLSSQTAESLRNRALPYRLAILYPPAGSMRRDYNAAKRLASVGVDCPRN